MSINGVSASALNGDRAASSDGVDDFGLADGPQNLLAQKQFGIALVFKTSDATDNTNWIGVRSSASRLSVSDQDSLDNSNGDLLIVCRDEAPNDLISETNFKLTDSQTHLVVANKSSNQDIKIYVDTMGTQANATLARNQGFDNTNIQASRKMAFFARNNRGTLDSHKDMVASFFEFNTEPYSTQERRNLKQRAPGLKK
jgi:hypothetical protein